MYSTYVTNPAEVLFDSYILDILTIVSENPRIKKSAIYENLGTSSSKPGMLVNKLIECGLLDETLGERSIKHISLTEEGERYLSMINAMLDGESIGSTSRGAPAAVRNSVKD